MREEYFIGVLAYTILQRLSEVLIAKRNTRVLLERGATEFGAAHYPYLVAMHTAFFASMIIEFIARPGAGLFVLPLILFLFAQALRFWTMRILRERWTTRVFVIKGEALVSRGPYRFLSHPNYLVVCLEILALPLAFSLWITASVFTILNAFVLFRVRIPIETKALEWSQT